MLKSMSSNLKTLKKSYCSLPKTNCEINLHKFDKNS